MEFLSVLLDTLNPVVILFSFFGVMFGIIVGAIPGLGVVMGMSILLPLTFVMEPLPALVLLSSIYLGAMCGDVIPAVLLGIPGTPSASADVLDGYPLAQQGKAIESLNLAMIGSFLGALFSIVVLILFSPVLVKIAIGFGPPEYFWLACLGLMTVASLAKGNINKGVIAAILGVLISTIGIDHGYGLPRLTFGSVNLLSGVPLIPPLVGIFAFSKVLTVIQERDVKPYQFQESTGNVSGGKFKLPALRLLSNLKMTFLRSSIVGTLVGVLPGAGGDIAAWMAYDQEKRASKTPERFGKGAIEGLVAADTANSAVVGGALVPLLALGIPGSAAAAVIYAGITIQGLSPGLELFTKNSKLVYALIAGLLLANLLTLICGIFSRNLIIRLLKMTPPYAITLIIAVSSIVGTYTISNNIFHVFVMVIFGIIGLFMNKLDYPPATMILGMILGPMVETSFRQSLIIASSRGWWMLFTGNRGIAMVLIMLLGLMIYLTQIRPALQRKRSTALK